MSTHEGLLGSWLHQCNLSCSQFFLGSHLRSALVTLRPCSQVSIAEESGSTFTRDSKFQLLGKSVLAYNSQFFSYLFIYPQDVFSHTGQHEDPAESDSIPRSHAIQVPGKRRGATDPALLLENRVSGTTASSGLSHTKRSSLSLVSDIFLHPQSGSSFLSLSIGSRQLFSSKPPLQPNS